MNEQKGTHNEVDISENLNRAKEKTILCVFVSICEISRICIVLKIYVICHIYHAFIHFYSIEDSNKPINKNS